MRTALKIALALLASLWVAPALAQSPTNVYVVDFTSNTTIAVSAAGHLRLRYNSGTGVLEQSIAGAAYTTLVPTATLASTYAAGTGSASSIMLLDSTRAGVIVRDSSPSSGSPLFAVQNNAANSFLSITPTAQQFIRSGSSDGAAAVGLAVDTFNGFANATSKILRVLTGNAERFFITGPGTVNLMAATAISGSGTFDLSAASGLFKTTTGAHTFGSATWSTPANLAVTVGASATNTVGLLLTPNVAAGATSVAFKVNNTTALTTGTLMQVGDNSVSRFQVVPLSTDGFQLVDSVGTTAFINVSTNNGVNINYGASNFAAGSGTASFTDATNTWTLTGGLLTGQRLKMLPVSSAQTNATESWRDSAGASRFGTDISGLPSLGSRFEHRINFQCATTAAGGAVNLIASQTNVTPTGCVPDWAYTSSANATGFVNTSGLATGSPIAGGITIGDGTTSTNSTTAQAAPFVLPANLTNLAIVYEQAVTMSAAGANNATFKVGIANGLLSAAHPGGYYFQKATGDTNWQCVTDDGATTSSGDTGVAAIASSSGAQVLRIEYYGAGTPLAGGTKTVKFYVDGVLSANCTRTTNVFITAGTAISWSALALSTTTSAQKTFSLGPVLLQFNEVASPFIP